MGFPNSAKGISTAARAPQVVTRMSHFRPTVLGSVQRGNSLFLDGTTGEAFSPGGTVLRIAVDDGDTDWTALAYSHHEQVHDTETTSMRELSIEELNLVSGGSAPPDPTAGGTIQSNPATITPIINSMLGAPPPLTGDWYVNDGRWCTTYTDSIDGGSEDFCFPPGTTVLQGGDNPG
jgi:hypothetical protein